MDSRVLLQPWQLQKQKQVKQSSGSCQPSVLQAGGSGGAEESRVTGKVKVLWHRSLGSFPLLLGPLVQTLGLLFEYFVSACYTDPREGYLHALPQLPGFVLEKKGLC